MKYFVVSDVHSYFTPMLKALDDAGFDKENSDHILCVLGDLLDRGNQSKELLEYVQSLGDRFIYVRGNHEDLLTNCIDEISKGYIPGYHHFSNGTIDTIAQLINMSRYDFGMRRPFELDNYVQQTMKPILDWIDDKAVDYYEVGDYVLVHSACPEDYKTCSREKWDAYRWENPFDFAEAGYIPEGKTLIFGHWHTNYAFARDKDEYEDWNNGCFDIYYGTNSDGQNYIGLDGCVAHTHKVNCIVLED